MGVIDIGKVFVNFLKYVVYFVYVYVYFFERGFIVLIKILGYWVLLVVFLFFKRF